ncbi:MAG TPA: cupin domain-containing protein, partial [Solirubrobacteraceae bacterium]|nr:cupin domain-containing protein [Solirubrobacteraceae bacterium]
MATATIVGPYDAKEGFLGSIGVRFLIDGSEVDRRLSLVDHSMSPRALAAPLHRHTREDEYSFVLEGRMGALLGDEVVEAGPGDLVH